MARLDLETEKALDTVRDRYGRTVHLSDAADIRTRRTRRALAGYRADLGESALPLLAAATQALHTMPSSTAVQAWHELIASLATSHGEIMRASTAPSEREAAAVWGHLAHWADTGPIAAHLSDLHHTPAAEFTADESRKWTERAQRARRRGALDLFESWFSADGRRITLAYLVEDDDSEVVALAGDPDAPGWAVIGRYDNELAAGTALPRPMPPGVLRPEGALRFNRPDPVHEVPLQELLRDVVEAHQAGDASNALLTATERGYESGPMTQLQQLVQTAAASPGRWSPYRGSASAPGSTPWAGSSASWPTKSAPLPQISARPWPSCLHTVCRTLRRQSRGPPSAPRPPQHALHTSQRTRAELSSRPQKALSP
ncbi:hypothetical protein [Streptomyces microflavus]|uniref:hypothetical protein n=1 Tax=Streptomyces microflavus TaxID=1919 RepID=UPI00368BDFE5